MVYSCHGQPLSRSHCRTWRWPPRAAPQHAVVSQGHPLKTLSHFTTSRWPPRAASHMHCVFHSQPRPRRNLRVSSCPPRAAAQVMHRCVMSHPCSSRSHSSNSTCPPSAAHSAGRSLLLPSAIMIGSIMGHAHSASATDRIMALAGVTSFRPLATCPSRNVRHARLHARRSSRSTWRVMAPARSGEPRTAVAAGCWAAAARARVVMRGPAVAAEEGAGDAMADGTGVVGGAAWLWAKQGSSGSL
mmetsp:Transcript_66691/g.211116  ORF Transcript_66691/g.211116 Transcript_66691/m.211116 type:complete len:244 (-) Transcript_66691:315-1046(-)